MIISVTNLKGGVGKSTISRNIAVYFSMQGHKVCIIDTDVNQFSTLEWSLRRGNEMQPVDVYPITSPEDLVDEVKKYQDEGYTAVIIDEAPHLDAIATNTILLSDVVLIPISPSIEDLGSYRRFLKRYEDAKTVLRGSRDIYAFTMINRYTDRNTEDVEIVDAINRFKAKGVIPLEAIIKERVGHKRASKYGLTVLDSAEYEAKEEVIQLCEELESKILQAFKAA